MIRIAFICLGSYHIDSWTEERNFDRQSLYSIALEQVLSFADSRESIQSNLSCDFFIIDNTVSESTQIIPELRIQFENPRIRDVQYINNNTLGSKNKGAGEYVMCQAVIAKHKDELIKYDWIVYYTLRQILVLPLIQKTIAGVSNNADLKKINTITANPPYFYFNKEKKDSASKNYCDMIFAMKPLEFFKYISTTSPEELVSHKLSSEQNLFNFIEKTNGIENFQLEHLGVMRYDYTLNKTQIL